MSVIGYARVSTAKQDEAAQVQALKDAGCEQVFHERISTMTYRVRSRVLSVSLGW